MVQIDAYKLLLTGEQILLGGVEDVSDEHWFVKLEGMGESFDWIFGHYAAVEDWFLHHLNGVPYETTPEWQKTYWPDTSGSDLTPENAVGRSGVITGFKETRQRLYTALKFDLLHLNRCVKKGVFPPSVKTRGDAWLFISAHSYWHVGQLDSLRAINGYPYGGGKGIHH
ncbi:MAG: DinB family protein [Halioglobus sp.]